MSVTIHTLNELAVGIPDKVTDGNCSEQTGLIGTAPFCATRYVNDERYRVRGRESSGGR